MVQSVFLGSTYFRDGDCRVVPLRYDDILLTIRQTLNINILLWEWDLDFFLKE